jgi:hemerythrin
MITWTTELETGHASVDNDHRKLVESLNALEAALREGAGKEKIAAMIGFLNQYAREHFKREEEHMQRTNCPAYAENCREHKAFVSRLNAWVLRLNDKPSTTLVLEVHRETVAWIRAHIIKVDCKLRGCQRSA